MFPKENAVRSEPYRRLVAALPCIKCGIHDYSQAAHPPPTGKGIKTPDTDCFPLCCVRPGNTGCHYLFDQNMMMPRDQMRETARMWAAATRLMILASGKWPKNLLIVKTVEHSSP